MARRSSARLRAKVSSTPQPKRVSHFDDEGALRTPKTAPKLSSLAESDEMPGAFPQSTSPAGNTPSRLAEHIAQAITGEHATPKRTTPIKPSTEEMHPQKFQMSTAKPLDEARWLGFSSMAPHTEPAKGSNKLAAAQGTPTKVHKAKAAFERPPEFDFTFSRPSLGLSPEARQLMAEKRDEAAKIREQMLASEEQVPLTANDLRARKLATPKGKVGRFSDVHMSAFKKLDSIANHPSAFRVDKASADVKTPKKLASQHNTTVATGTQSLKRTQSKADLTQPSTGLPRPTPKRDLQQSDAPAKRVKRAADDDVGSSRPKSSGSDAPSTPKDAKSLRVHGPTSRLPTGLSTPTASSLARAASVKSNKRTMIPGLARGTPKVGMTSASLQQHKPSTPLLARSPSKMPIPASAAKSTAPEPQSPLLSRSAVKPAIKKQLASQDADESDTSSSVRFMARSPSKMSAISTQEGGEKPNKTPLLSQSPSKIAIREEFSAGSGTPGKSAGTNLMTRFNLLRASPMKSILRTPQRLYSNDPAKIASGTHFATPEKADSNIDRPTLAVPPKTAPVQKHVDFTASTKSDNGRGDKPDTPSKTPMADGEESEVSSPQTSAPTQFTFAYPSLPPHEPAIKKSHRRKTMALPSDFTFRAGEGITFAPSSDRSSAARDLKSSIRHVSAEPDLASASSKKRKLSGLDEKNGVYHKQHESSDKENGADEDEQRPAKRSRPSAPVVPPTPQPAKTPRKIPTLGVRPKSTQKPKEKRPGFLSQARLNALATPKRR